MEFQCRRSDLLLSFLCGVTLFVFVFLLMASTMEQEERTGRLSEKAAYKKAPKNIIAFIQPAQNTTDKSDSIDKTMPSQKDKDKILFDQFARSNKARQDQLERADRARKEPAVIEPPVEISSEIVPCSPDNTECQRFRTLLFENWPLARPKAAFYFLTMSTRLKYLQRALRSLDDHFNKYYRYPIIVFHEADLVDLIPRIRTFTSSNIFFQEIRLEAPESVKEIPTLIPCVSTIGYRHMCRFHVKGVFQQPIMRGLEYYWRLDDDSILTENITYDVFLRMQLRNLEYGFIWRHLDNLDCTTGLWNVTHTYVRKNKVIPSTPLGYWPEPWLFYNNFEVSSLRPWLSEGYANYIDHIDKAGGIYYHRWGDAPIRGLSVTIFVAAGQIHQFKDIGYQHGGFIYKPQS